ncbi:hypothetical protein CC78DRAFT_584617 [Lojkania enalia]|uniref:Uncharacterized protein n=1 Tax=Lojkania enalia TaxID=147567 RepID=A0A9P4K113_9PLEO|nr:hypothetical protein CC78DRAFT_584617 [Didymosphaeria enalia]
MEPVSTGDGAKCEWLSPLSKCILAGGRDDGKWKGTGTGTADGQEASLPGTHFSLEDGGAASAAAAAAAAAATAASLAASSYGNSPSTHLGTMAAASLKHFHLANPVPQPPTPPAPHRAQSDSGLENIFVFAFAFVLVQQLLPPSLLPPPSWLAGPRLHSLFIYGPLGSPLELLKSISTVLRALLLLLLLPPARAARRGPQEEIAGF